MKQVKCFTKLTLVGFLLFVFILLFNNMALCQIYINFQNKLSLDEIEKSIKEVTPADFAKIESFLEDDQQKVDENWEKKVSDHISKYQEMSRLKNDWDLYDTYLSRYKNHVDNKNRINKEYYMNIRRSITYYMVCKQMVVYMGQNTFSAVEQTLSNILGKNEDGSPQKIPFVLPTKINTKTILEKDSKSENYSKETTFLQGGKIQPERTGTVIYEYKEEDAKRYYKVFLFQVYSIEPDIPDIFNSWENLISTGIEYDPSKWKDNTGLIEIINEKEKLEIILDNIIENKPKTKKILLHFDDMIRKNKISNDKFMNAKRAYFSHKEDIEKQLNETYKQLNTIGKELILKLQKINEFEKKFKVYTEVDSNYKFESLLNNWNKDSNQDKYRMLKDLRFPFPGFVGKLMEEITEDYKSDYSKRPFIRSIQDGDFCLKEQHPIDKAIQIFSNPKNQWNLKRKLENSTKKVAVYTKRKLSYEKDLIGDVIIQAYSSSFDQYIAIYAWINERVKGEDKPYVKVIVGVKGEHIKTDSNAIAQIGVSDNILYYSDGVKLWLVIKDNQVPLNYYKIMKKLSEYNKNKVENRSNWVLPSWNDLLKIKGADGYCTIPIVENKLVNNRLPTSKAIRIHSQFKFFDFSNPDIDDLSSYATFSESYNYTFISANEGELIEE